MRLTRPAAPRTSASEPTGVRPHSAPRASIQATGLAKLALVGALGSAGFSGCSGSASAEFSGDLFIESCSLACTDGSGGTEVTCSIVDVTRNQEISMIFSEPIDPSTVNASSLQVIDVANGTTPDGLRFVDPMDPRRVIFRPTVSFETGVDFSFERNRSYEVLIPGVSNGSPGPFIRSTVGNPNLSRLNCTVFTSQGVSDTVPGDPAVDVFADVVQLDGSGAPLLDGNGNPIVVREQIGTDFDSKVENIALNSNIYFEFNELMNLPTVANNQFMSSPYIIVELDGDGNLATGGADRSTISGAYTVTVDQELLTTSMLYIPDGGFPAASEGDPTPSLLVVRIPTEVSDIAQNPVTTATGGGTLVAVAQRLSFDPVVIPDDDGENFDVPAGMPGSQEAANESGAGLWGSIEPGILAPGVTGGSGRHGSLHIPAGATVILNTESQVFPLEVGGAINVIGNPDGMGDYPRTITATDGVFEFSTLQLGVQARLILTGANPARIVVRGETIIGSSAVIDVSGRSAPIHDSTIVDSDDFFADPVNEELIPIGGPNASSGGVGGDRADYTGNVTMMDLGGAASPNSTRQGRAGSGIGGSGSLGRGNGGPAFPVTLPVTSILNEVELAGVGFNITPDPVGTPGGNACVSVQIGGVGSGGGYSSVGSAGTPLPQFPVTDWPIRGTAPSTTNSNGSVSLAAPDANNVGYATRILRWDTGDLRGGASGGGGGNHAYGTRNSAVDPTIAVDCMAFAVFMTRFSDHSAAAGGGAGGGFELTAGRSIELSGSVNASGGAGGSSIAATHDLGSFAMPGGGGSGGAVRLRAPDVDVTDTGSIDIGGGAGGNALWSEYALGVTTRGGDGSPGLIRIEDTDSGLIFADVADHVVPGGVDVLDYLSVAPGYLTTGNVATLRPDAISTATSCWFRPPGAFQTLGARADETGVNTVESKGWTMDVVMTGGATRPYRGVDGAGQSWEEQYGNLLGFDLGVGEVASPIVVRFQGARSLGQTLSNPCDLNLDADPIADIQPGSLTPWVSHPADLELLLNGSGSPYAPTMIRYIVIFDKTDDAANMDRPGQIFVAEDVIGVDNLRIEADPR